MVRLLLWLALALAGCSARAVTVLIARDGGVESDVDAARERGEGSSAADASSPGLAPDARSADAQPADLGVQRSAVCRIDGAPSGFYENFAGSVLSDNWLVAHGTHSFAGRTPRGGFVRDNVALRDGALVLTVRGDRYTGSVRGISSTGAALADGRRSGAAVATQDLFASGTYQVAGRFVGPPGVELAVWVMGDDDEAGGIDSALPGQLGSGVDAGRASYAAVRMRTRSSRAAGAGELFQLALAQSLDDGQAHILRFDWYTTATPAVQFWLDDMPRWSATTSLPDGATRRLWIVAWLPDDQPADFDSAELRVENAFITPFGNDGDRCTAGTLRSPGLVAPR